MNQLEIDLLIRKYYNGESTEEEELRLKSMLQDENLPEAYFIERDLFRSLGEAGDIPAPSEGFESMIMDRIAAVHARESTIGIRRKLYSVVAVAASLLIIISSYFLVYSNQRPEDTFTDPELAYIQTLEVLRMVSEGLNSGKNMMSDLSYISEAAESIEIVGYAGRNVTNQLKPLEYFDKGLKIVGSTTKGNNEVN